MQAPCVDPLDYIPFLSPEFRRPDHLRSLGALFTRVAAWARGDSDETIRTLVTFPIRHFKTETVLALAIWLLEQTPWLTIMILSYDADRAEELGKRMRELVQRVDDRPYIGPAKGWNRLDRWKNSEGGGVIILSADQSKEGFNCNVLIADDPMNEKQARTLEERDKIDRTINFYTGRCLLSTPNVYRRGPVIIVASRFCIDDMTGRRLARGGWENLYHPVISDGKPFAPNVFSIELLAEIRAELAESDPLEAVWWSRWMGVPVEERGQNRFKDPARYEMLPNGHDAVGVHFMGEGEAWFAVVDVRISAGNVYVKSCERFAAAPAELAKRIKEIGATSVYGYMSGSERIALRHLAQHGIQMQPLTAGQNRLWRTERTIVHWNAGRVLSPSGYKATIERFKKFTGGEDEENEEIDALVAVVEGALMWTTPANFEWVGTRRMK